MSDQAITRPIVYRNPLNDIPDQWMFFTFFAVGGTAICTLKSIGYSQFIVTAVPLSLMFLYAAVALVTKRYRVREDRVGDNMYYLGFLYTLVSLAYALWAFTSDGAATETIITNFGIAIATTIVGLAGRVFFSQMRQDPVEYEREARVSLADASRGMKAQLDDISVEMSSFKRRLVQIMEEGVTDISSKASVTLQKHLELFTTTSTDVIEKIRIAFSHFTDHSSRLNEIAAKNAEALDALFQRIEKIEASPDLLASKLDPVMAKFDEVAEESLKRTRAHNAELKKLREMVDVAVKSAEGMLATVKNTDMSVTERLSQLTTSVEAGVAATSRLTDTLDKAGTAIATDLDRSKQTSVKLRELVDLQLEAAKGTAAGLREAVGIEMKGAQRVLTDMRDSMSAELEEIKRHRAESAAILQESRGLAAELERALISLARTMTEKLGGS